MVLKMSFLYVADYPKDGDGINHGDFKYASELNEFLKKTFLMIFCLSGGCYPETHYELKTLKKIF